MQKVVTSLHTWSQSLNDGCRTSLPDTAMNGGERLLFHYLVGRLALLYLDMLNVIKSNQRNKSSL